MYKINNEKSETIIKKPKDMFSRFGILHLIFSNDEPFGSVEFKRLAERGMEFALITQNETK